MIDPFASAALRQHLFFLCDATRSERFREGGQRLIGKATDMDHGVKHLAGFAKPCFRREIHRKRDPYQSLEMLPDEEETYLAFGQIYRKSTSSIKPRKIGEGADSMRPDASR